MTGADVSRSRPPTRGVPRLALCPVFCASAHVAPRRALKEHAPLRSIDWKTTTACMILAMLLIACSASAADRTEARWSNVSPSQRFENWAELPWQRAFTDTGGSGWRDRWHLDGKHARIEPGRDGFAFHAGAERGVDAHHAVLWTRPRFEGDVRISYDYTRLDKAEHDATMLYIQATGTGIGPYKKDIMQWANRRTVPAMSKYSQHMDLLHVSYAAMPTSTPLERGVPDRMYSRARRYPIPANAAFEDTIIPRTYFPEDLWQTGVTHHVDVIKRGPMLMMKVTPEGGKSRYRYWNASGWSPIKGGRIGLRHMAGRAARYEDFTVQTLPEDAPSMAQRWRELTSVADAVAAYPERLRSLIEALDLERSDLNAVRAAWKRDDLKGACKALLDYYRQVDPGRVRGAQRVSPGEGDIAEARLQRAKRIVESDIYVGHDMSTRVPRNANGILAWGYTGPNRDQGFRSRLNRHPHLDALLRAYQATGERQYLQRLDADLRSWLIAADGRLMPWGTHTLEPALRAVRWPRIFYALQHEPDFQPATRLLLLATLPDHAAHLQEALRPKHNFATMQMNGLGTLGATFPEFNGAKEWRRFALDQMMRELEAQVYPDGVQKEMTTSYHWVALRHFERLARTLRHAGYDVPNAYSAQLERMYGYLVNVMRPDGTMPLNNDGSIRDMRSRLLDAAQRYERPDWRYVASNGAEGKRPQDPPSRFFPWAGQLISRTGWHEDSHWSFFDVSPYGISHQHNDKLHLSISAFGRDVLVDTGRFAYSGRIADQFRDSYALHSRGHNVILVDGMGQQATEPEAEHRHPWGRVTEQADIAIGAFAAGYDPKPTGAGEAWGGLSRKERFTQLNGIHQRAVVHVPERGWLVFDRMRVRGAHTISPLWHFHPHCTVAARGQQVMSTDPGAGNVRVTPVGPIDWSVKIVRARKKPTPQGWYSPGYSQVKEATCAVYQGRMTDAATFGWVITPGRGRPESVSVDWIEAPRGTARMRVTWPDGARSRATVNFDGAKKHTTDTGDTFHGRALVQTDGRPPAVLGGRLRDAAGQRVDAHAPPIKAELAATLDELTHQLRPEPARSRDGEQVWTWTLQPSNATRPHPVQWRADAADDNGAGWRIDIEPANLTVAPGETRTLTVRAAIAAGAPRYPLPDVVLTASANINGKDETVTQRKRWPLPLIDAQPRVRAQALARAPRIDGHLNESAWDRAPDVSAFGRMNLKRDPAPGTKAWLGYDQKHLYVAFRCMEPRKKAFKHSAERRDDKVFLDDSVELMFEPDGDGKGRDYYHIAVNAAGVIFDGRGFDKAVDLTGLSAAARTGEGAWTAEVAIPWTALNVDSPRTKAGLLLSRNRPTPQGHDIFQFPVSPDGNHQPAMFARWRPQAR